MKNFTQIFDQIVSQTHVKMLGIGKNYPGTQATQQTPFPSVPIVFLKSMDSLTKNPSKLSLKGKNLVHEVELGFMISKKAKEIDESNWEEYIAGYFLAFDLTDKDLLFEAREKGFPWSFCKGQADFCPVSNFIDKSLIKDPHNLDLQFYQNGKCVVSGNTSQMHFKIPYLMKYISSIVTLNPGDMVITGSPPHQFGVLKENDKVEGFMKENQKIIEKIKFDVFK